MASDLPQCIRQPDKSAEEDWLAVQQKSGPRTAKGFLDVVRILLLVVGVVLIAVYVVSRLHTEVMSRLALRQFSKAAQRGAIPGNATGAPTGANREVDFGLWSMKRITAYEESLTMQFDPPLAVLEIPKLGLEVPVFNGTDDLTLNRGVGRIIGTARPGEGGNVGIAGHRDGFFRGLKDMKVGDSLELELTDRKEVYRVDQIQIVKPDDVQVLGKREAPTLTLVTCYPFYYIGNAPQRFIVQASLLKGSPKERQALSPVQ